MINELSFLSVHIIEDTIEVHLIDISQGILFFLRWFMLYEYEVSTTACINTTS
ncbi:hypothetical protein D3C71_1858710 [compost metagenome]